jgi:hypothetical protein
MYMPIIMYLPMDDITSFVNSPIGLLLIGSLTSGIIVQFIVTWYTDRKTRMNKQIEVQYELLNATNRAIAKILAQSQNVVASYEKKVGSEQLTSDIEAYNSAEMEWEVDARGFWLQLRVYFNTEAIIRKWDIIKQQRDELDVALYQLGTHETTPDECRQKINTLSTNAAELSRMMYARIGKWQ